MRVDVLETSLRGIQRRRLRGLAGLRSLTDPMIPGGGSYVGASSSVTMTAAAPRMRVPATSVISTPLQLDARSIARTSIPSAAASGAGMVLPGVFDPSRGFTPGAPPSTDPLGVGADVADAAELADTERAADGDVVISTGGAPIDTSSSSPATRSPLSRYKWWVLGLVMTLLGASAWAIWRPRR